MKELLKLKKSLLALLATFMVIGFATGCSSEETETEETDTEETQTEEGTEEGSEEETEEETE